MSRIRNAPFASLALVAALASALPASAQWAATGAPVGNELSAVMRAPARRGATPMAPAAPQLLALASTQQAVALPATLASSVPMPAPVVAAASPALQAATTAVVAPTAAANPANEARFDLSVNNAPAAQVFLQLGNGTAYNMLVAPEVSGTLSVTLKNTTVLEAMDTLRELFGYEYRVTGNRIFVYPNTVQTRLYRINYLPGRRQGASDIRVTSSAITLTGTGNSSNNNNSNSGSNNSNGGNGNSGQSQRPDDSSHVRTTSDADFWREVQASLTALVGTAGGRNVVLNPAAGVVVIKATPGELRQVENYLKAVQLSIERQVMLEAKIVEVELSRDSQTGINWAGFGRLLGSKTALTIGSAAPGATLQPNGSLSVDGNTVTPGGALAAAALGKGFYGMALQSTNFAALLNFLQTQGDVQVLSSPRIATLNNQKAVLKVGSDELYVTGVTSNTTSTGNSTVSTPTVTLQPFFAGIALDVTPQIDENGQVMLHIHPSISTVTEKQKNIDLGTLGSFRLPLAASTVNETDSIVRVRDGQIVAIGGLMKQVLQNDRSGLPGLSDAPVVGGLFRQTNNVMSKRELVIMLKPTIITDDGGWPDAGGIANMTAPVAPQ